ncbi:hypothetical protein CC86DRAFT_71907 [Ophiobolus disseminans]|uniref:Uncharacterized protein n=1 Tax=Ophiobolus disseminans TaxID=1469910 RepID=A0A6A6ZNW9_9PLEO|nr:hypothetical protein CC86DRAFT_71907 [Ophiobolus disseminans]
MVTPSLWSFLFRVYIVFILSARADAKRPFSCTGGVVYFTAHPVDGLLYQNPDLLHDIYVFKCVTTVVLTSGDRGTGGNFSLSLERGLQEAYALMAGLPISDVTQGEETVQIGTHHVHSWSLNELPNIQIIYLRLADSLPSGHGYAMHGNDSLAQLYSAKIDSIATTDSLARYTLRDLKEVIAFILHSRKPTYIRMLNHKAVTSAGDKHAEHLDHADHVVSAKLVQRVITGEKLQANVQSYGGNNVRKFEANVNSTHRDFGRKANAFFKYAAYDEHMCQSLDECSSGFYDGDTGSLVDDDVRYVAQYLGREYYVL